MLFRSAAVAQAPLLRAGAESTELRQVNAPRKLTPGTWCREGEYLSACFALPKGASRLAVT